MSVYVDSPRFMKKGGRKRYCHLVADTFDELHSFALSIGVKRHFFHSSASWQHYDLSEELHSKALAFGAVEVSSRVIVDVSKRMMYMGQSL